ncbi:hypothetical protein [Streptomyces sp. NPDC056632]|uniref:hypothetical protein n=1 Tax=Streptomyces sp. NPDC056632 TaxID=3345884 RepID=UPI00368A1335
MTDPRREPAGPATPNLHDQWAASRLEDALENLADLVGAFFTVEDEDEDGDSHDPDSPQAVNP